MAERYIGVKKIVLQGANGRIVLTPVGADPADPTRTAYNIGAEYKGRSGCADFKSEVKDASFAEADVKAMEAYMSRIGLEQQIDDERDHLGRFMAETGGASDASDRIQDKIDSLEASLGRLEGQPCSLSCLNGYFKNVLQDMSQSVRKDSAEIEGMMAVRDGLAGGSAFVPDNLGSFSCNQVGLGIISVSPSRHMSAYGTRVMDLSMEYEIGGGVKSTYRGLINVPYPAHVRKDPYAQDVGSAVYKFLNGALQNRASMNRSSCTYLLGFADALEANMLGSFDAGGADLDYFRSRCARADKIIEDMREEQVRDVKKKQPAAHVGYGIYDISTPGSVMFCKAAEGRNDAYLVLEHMRGSDPSVWSLNMFRQDPAEPGSKMTGGMVLTLPKDKIPQSAGDVGKAFDAAQNLACTQFSGLADKAITDVYNAHSVVDALSPFASGSVPCNFADISTPHEERYFADGRVDGTSITVKRPAGAAQHAFYDVCTSGSMLYRQKYSEWPDSLNVSYTHDPLGGTDMQAVLKGAVDKSWAESVSRLEHAAKQYDKVHNMAGIFSAVSGLDVKADSRLMEGGFSAVLPEGIKEALSDAGKYSGFQSKACVVAPVPEAAITRRRLPDFAEDLLEQEQQKVQDGSGMEYGG